VDSLLIIENEKLSTVMEQEDVSIIEVFRRADKVVVDIVAAIARIINSHGYINLDLADLKNVLNRGGIDGCVDAYIGLGEASGPDRGMRASEMALSNPLLRTISIKGAANLLVNVAGSEQLGHKEAMGIVKNIVDHVGIDSQEIFFGVVTDDGMGDTISVTVIATGLSSVGDSATKIKPVDCSISKNRARQPLDQPEITSIRITRDSNAGNELTEDSREVVDSNFQNDKAGFSPMIRKDEWLIPAYLRTVAKTAEFEERLADPRVRKISKCKDYGHEADQGLNHPQFRQPLYHMAG
jgi:cell division protein FtsZ